MALDPQIPLSVTQQPSFAQQAGQVYQLAGAMEKQQEYQQQKQDHQIMQEGLKQEGINMTTSEGLMKLADWSKEHGVSVKSQGIIGNAISDSRKQDLEMRHLLTQQSLDNNKIGAGKKAEIGDQLTPVWDQWKQDKDTVGEEAANVNLQKNLQPAIEKMATRMDASGKPYYDSNVVKQLSGVNNGKSLESELNRIDSFRKTQQEIYDAQLTQQKIAESKKRELFIGKEKAGRGGFKMASLSPEQQEALDSAMSRGLLDPRKLNSRTAPMWADQYIKNPDLDMNRLASDASMMQNATFMQKQLILETLPEIMTNMVEAGKKVDFSDVKLAGKIELWKKGQLNDPDLQAYMTQRNDAMMTIASVMRGVGMSDKAIEQELQAAPETMSPKALEGWMRGQMKALKPRLRFAEKYTRSGNVTENKPNTGKSTEVPRGAAPKGLPEGSKQIGHTPDGKPVWQSPDGKKYVE